mmetsp:Transcript_158893/g.509618  ORF Transcript_158893/g.509618 Transcript_158893/m.509618 type:complete len:557 (+) Transcript_158893:40-1710(+)
MSSWYSTPVQFLPWERESGSAHYKGAKMAQLVAARYMRSPRNSEPKLKEISVAVEVANPTPRTARRTEVPLRAVTPPRPELRALTPPRRSEGGPIRGLTPPRLPMPVVPWLSQLPPMRPPNSRAKECHVEVVSSDSFATPSWSSSSSSRLAGEGPAAGSSSTVVASPWQPPTEWPTLSGLAGSTSTVVAAPWQPPSEQWPTLSGLGTGSLPTARVGDAEPTQRQGAEGPPEPPATERKAPYKSFGMFGSRRDRSESPGVTARGSLRSPAAARLPLPPTPAFASSLPPPSPSRTASPPLSMLEYARREQQAAVGSPWSAAIAARSSAAVAALPTMLMERSAQEEVLPTLGLDDGSTAAAQDVHSMPSSDIVAPSREAVAVMNTAAMSTASVGGAAMSTASVGGIEPSPPNRKCGLSWEYPLSRKEKRDRILRITDIDREMSEAWAVVSDRRAEQYCKEAAELRVENERLREIISDLRPVAVVKNRCYRYGLAGKKGARKNARGALRRRWARRVELRVTRAEQQAKQEASSEAQARWLQDRLVVALSENDRFRSMWVA